MEYLCKRGKDGVYCLGYDLQQHCCVYSGECSCKEEDCKCTQKESACAKTQQS